MSLTRLRISEEVWSACLAHALSTETEEVMGLLFGDISENKGNGSVVAHIWGSAPQARSDRRKDRVETTPEQLAEATASAERMTRSIGKTTRVIGWYHSHPHITVHPSHVDVRTQGDYQLMDQGFVGIIFSCFNEDIGNKSCRIQVIAFQSIPKSRPGARQFASAQEPDSGSRTLIASINLERQLEQASLSHQAGEEVASFSPANPTSSTDESDLSHFSPGMQEAMHLSSLEMSSGEYTSKEIPIEIVPFSEFGLPKSTDYPLLSLQHTLFEEEKSAFERAMRQSLEGRSLHPLAALHHVALYRVSLARLLEFCTLPAMASLWDKHQENKAKLARLQDEAMDLQLCALGAVTPRSMKNQQSNSH